MEATSRDPRRKPLSGEEEGLFRLRYLAAEGSPPPSWRELERTLKNLEAVALEVDSSTDGMPCFRYWNPDTHVEACFRGYVAEEPDEAGLAFEMGLPRPEYFAHEALPLAVQVARELHLDTLPHGTEWTEDPLPPSKESLLSVWRRRNTDAREWWERENGPAPSFRADELELSWEYLTLREDLERRHGRRGVAVPGIEYVRLKKTGQVLRLCRWHSLRPTVFPPVDLVYLEKPPAPLKTGKIISADELSEVGRRWVRDVPQPIFHRIYLEDTPPDGFVDLLDELKGTSMRSYEPVPVEALHDV